MTKGATEPSPTREEIVAIVRRIAAETEGLELEAVTAESDFERDLGMDSLSIVELELALEQEFELTLTEDAVAGVRTIGGAADAVLRGLQAR